MTRWAKTIPGFQLLLAAAALKLAIHLFVYFNLPDPFGIFRDELYYLACADRLDWGYVDHPPLSMALLAGAKAIFGDSLFLLRLLPALIGAAIVFFAGWISAELGGGRYAQLLTVTATLALPSHLAIHGFFSMNPLDHLLWTLSALFIIRLIKQPSLSLWLGLGITLGLGLQNKMSVLFFGFGLAVGILATPQRRWLFDKGLWLCAAIAFAIFSPHILWQIAHGWPTLEFISNAANFKNIALTPVAFFSEVILQAQPLAAPVWLAGLYWLLASRHGETYRLFGVQFIAIVAVFLLQNAKPYYLAPIYPLLMAAGAVCWGQWLSHGWKTHFRPVLAGAVLIGGIIVMPIVAPVFPPDRLVDYMQTLGVRPSSGERADTGELPQLFADMIGWEALAARLSVAMDALPENERAESAILVTNYGQAGAVEYYRERYNLPRVLCTHNNYWYWAEFDPPPVVYLSIIGDELNHDVFERVETVGAVIRPLSMPYEDGLLIQACREPKRSLSEAWSEYRNFF